MRQIAVTGSLAAGHGQGWHQVELLLLAFALSSMIGLERELRGKSAGLRTQSIVGTTAALLLLIGKYGFADVLVPGQISLDPSRVASQIVSGVGFLGAGLILTRQGSVHGLTTAAAVWETAAIGMAAGAGLPLLAGLVTTLHFAAVFGYTAVVGRLPGGRTAVVRVRVRYLDGQGVLRQIMSVSTSAGWLVGGLATDRRPGLEHQAGIGRSVAVVISLSGSADRHELLARLADLPGVLDVDLLADEDNE